MSSVKQEQSLDQTQPRESETPQSKPSTTDRVVDSEYCDHVTIFTFIENLFFEIITLMCLECSRVSEHVLKGIL
jgi:hypothetical protein